MQTDILLSLVIIFSLSTVVVYVFHWIKIPSVVGFLLTGAIIGPMGLALIDDPEQVEGLAEVGVVLLLFTIGMEFSFKRLAKIKRVAILGGGLQVVVTILITMALIAAFTSLAMDDAIVIGCIMALSSTAIVLSLFQAKGETKSIHGQVSTGMLIFQDLAIVPMMLCLPLLAGGHAAGQQSIYVILGKIVLVMGIILVGVRYAVPRVLHQAAKTRNSELFLITVALICVGVAYATSLAGLSLALGAFLAGLMVAESRYNHQALSEMTVFKDIFSSFFFISIGMMMNLSFFDQHLLIVAFLTVCAIFIKTVVTGGVILLLGYPLRTAVISGLAMSQIGEFAFVLIKNSANLHILTPSVNQYAIDASILTMAVTPFTIFIGPKVADLLYRLPLPKRILSGAQSFKPLPPEVKLKQHIIIVGYGVTGQMLAHTAKSSGLQYVIFDMNPEKVKRYSEKGEAILYGDAGQPVNLETVNAAEAKLAVIAINDPMATRRIIVALRSVSSSIHIIVRTKYYETIDEYAALGADEVISQDYESAMDIFSRVLAAYNVPQEQISHFINEARAGGYSMFRYPKSGQEVSEIYNITPILMDIDTKVVTVEKRSAADGKTLGELNLRFKYGITVMVIRRKEENYLNPGAETKLLYKDMLLISGPSEAINKALPVFAAANKSAPDAP